MKNLFPILCLLLAVSCKNNPEAQPLFTNLDPESTGIRFSNTLNATRDFNLFKYMYFYNGAGVGAGDFNNDGRIDLFFAANQSANCLYLNEGDLHFKDVSKEAGLPADSAWSTGVSVVDINNDGLLDIYVCRVGQYEVLHGKNQLLICTGIDNGIPHYRDAAAEWGVDFSGFSTQAAFLDYDLDGDLDMFLLNHSVHHNGTFGERKLFMGTTHPLSGDRFFRNDGNRFTDVTKESGINSSVIGYGLGIAVADINLDGYPDIYIGNDFHENDYLYINQRNGSFKDELTSHIMHTSQFSMGVDVADVNNDALPEIISMDMLPEDPYVLKRSLGEDEYNLFYTKIGYGYNYQYTRNNLQYNRGNGLFSELGVYAGIHATDWSWAALWMDMDNDGWKDLFVSNGIPKRMNDMDFVNFVSSEEVQQQVKSGNAGEKELLLEENFPEIKLNNKFFLNKGSLKFEDATGSVRNEKPGFSNGAIYADLDNDGDLDIVVNNINDPARVYRNNSVEHGRDHFLRLHLEGPPGNRNAVGATLVLFEKDGSIRTYEKTPVHGFQSSMEIPLQVGLGDQLPDSALLIWPDRSSQPCTIDSLRRELRLTWSPGLPLFDKSRLKRDPAAALPLCADITADRGIHYLHEEDPFGEFDREQLIPHKASTEGPALAVADINGDGLDDFFIGAAKDRKPAVYAQEKNGRFHRLPQPALDKDSMYEDVDAVWADINKDGFPDLLVASGGNEYFGTSPRQQSRIYVNDGRGLLTRQPSVLDKLLLTASSICVTDLNKDGFPDIFLGARCSVYEYGKVPKSYLLINNGRGDFTDQTEALAPGLSQAGFVKEAQWIDLDKDGDPDLLLAVEWDAPLLYENRDGKLLLRKLSDRKGWWNFLRAVDIDGDGDLDLIAGNQGQNFRLQPSAKEPVRLYYTDFDGNGKKEQVLSYYIKGVERPFANKMELDRQIPLMKKKFLYAEDFARADMEKLFGRDKLEKAEVLTADYFSNALLLNDGKGNFSTIDLPWQSQLTAYWDAVPLDYNQDGRTDILLFGNYYDNNIQMGRVDADYGSLLLNNGSGKFDYRLLPGLAVKGQVRKTRRIQLGGGVHNGLLLARNSDSLQLISLPENIPAYR